MLGIKIMLLLSVTWIEMPIGEIDKRGNSFPSETSAVDKRGVHRRRSKV